MNIQTFNYNGNTYPITSYNPVEHSGRTFCPSCGRKVVYKHSEYIKDHFAHIPGESCLPRRTDFKRHSGIGEWHLNWQRCFRDADLEIQIEGNRLDLRLDNYYIEFQNSPISIGDIRKRENTYGDKLIWISNNTKSASVILGDYIITKVNKWVLETSKKVLLHCKDNIIREVVIKSPHRRVLAVPTQFSESVVDKLISRSITPIGIETGCGKKIICRTRMVDKELTIMFDKRAGKSLKKQLLDMGFEEGNPLCYKLKPNEWISTPIPCNDRNRVRRQYNKVMKELIAKKDERRNVIIFGKHKGKHFTDVLKKDIKYCEWVLSINEPKGALKGFHKWLKCYLKK